MRPGASSNMSAEEFHAARVDLRLSQRLLARFLGVELRSVRRWETDREIPVQTAVVMRLMIRSHLSAHDVYRWMTGNELEGDE